MGIPPTALRMTMGFVSVAVWRLQAEESQRVKISLTSLSTPSSPPAGPGDSGWLFSSSEPLGPTVLGPWTTSQILWTRGPERVRLELDMRKDRKLSLASSCARSGCGGLGAGAQEGEAERLLGGETWMEDKGDGDRGVALGTAPGDDKSMATEALLDLEAAS